MPFLRNADEKCGYSTLARCVAGVVLPLAAVVCSRIPANVETPLVRAVDHVLLWAQQPESAATEFRALGFNVQPGQAYPEGMTASTVTFRDWSYLELLHFANLDAARGSAQAQRELAFVSAGSGVLSLAIEVRDVAAASAFLSKRGFSVGQVDVDMVDPDGPTGPQPPHEASWRDFRFAASPVSGVDLFFIQYRDESSSAATSSSQFATRTTHANSAQRLSAVWVLVGDLAGEAAVYERMGFVVGPAIDVAHLAGRARVATLGTSAIILVEATSLPEQHRLPSRPGPRVIGLSFEVASLDTTRRAIAGRHVGDVSGPMGPALIAPMTSTLGVVVDFHERRR